MLEYYGLSSLILGVVLHHKNEWYVSLSLKTRIYNYYTTQNVRPYIIITVISDNQITVTVNFL